MEQIEKFREDYQDEIPEGGKRLYKIVTKETAETLYANVEILRSNMNLQYGDDFNAKLLNSITKILNIIIDSAVFLIETDEDTVTYGTINELMDSKGEQNEEE